MRIFNLARGQGKTIRMLYASEYHNAPIVVSRQETKQHIMDMAKWKGINIPEPITVDEMSAGRIKGKNYKDVLVDNMDTVLNRMLAQYGLSMIGGTITIDNEVSND